MREEDNGVDGITEDDDVEIQEGDGTAMGWYLGYAVSKKGEKGQVWAGAILSGSNAKFTYGDELDKFNTNTYEYEYFAKDSVLDLTLAIAGEVKAKDWLVLRGGVSASVWNVSKESYGTDYTNDNNSNANWDNEYYDKYTNGDLNEATVTLGFGLPMGDFQVDAVLEQQLLFDGPNVIGGVDNTGLASRISLCYFFGAGRIIN